jgi:DNA-directed RNA polymerase specialized sigma24 family protein
VARLQGADAAAFDAVHAAFNTALFNFLARLSRRRDVAEDLLEETWLRFVDRAHRFADDTGSARCSSRSRATFTSATAARARSRITAPRHDRLVAARHRRGHRRSNPPSPTKPASVSMTRSPHCPRSIERRCCSWRSKA